MSHLTLKLLDPLFTIHRFPPRAEIPRKLLDEEFVAITRTSEELSIVCTEDVLLDSLAVESGWRGFKVEGPLDFSLTGVISGLSRSLAEAGVSLFVISTYDTDYLLVRAAQLNEAEAALVSAGYVLR